MSKVPVEDGIIVVHFVGPTSREGRLACGSSCASQCHTESRKWFDLIFGRSRKKLLDNPYKIFS